MVDTHRTPSERARALVAGAYDTHIHISPDVMTRRSGLAAQGMAAPAVTAPAHA